MSVIGVIRGMSARGGSACARVSRSSSLLRTHVYQLSALPIIIIILSSCYHTPETVAKMNDQEIHAVSDWDICNAWEQTSSRTPLVLEEEKKRGLDCQKKIADYKAFLQKEGITGTPQSPATTIIGRPAGSQAAGAGNAGGVPGGRKTLHFTISPFSIPVEEGECPQTRFAGLTNDESKALKYLFVKKALKDWGCLTELKADEKIKIRGQTVVRYTAIVSFPKGYRTPCLNVPDGGSFQGWDVWMQQTSGCSVHRDDPLGAPAAPGTVRVIHGEDII